VSAASQNSVTPGATLPYARFQVNIHWKGLSLEGAIASFNTLIGWLYLVLANSITGGVAWLLFLCLVAAFLLSIFASVKQSRWWFAVTVLAFLLLMTLSHATEGCATNPCPL
jgi:hypothetical protein